MVKPPSFYRRENRAWYNVLSLRAERPVLRLAQNEIAHRAIPLRLLYRNRQNRKVLEGSAAAAALRQQSRAWYNVLIAGGTPGSALGAE